MEFDKRIIDEVYRTMGAQRMLEAMLGDEDAGWELSVVTQVLFDEFQLGPYDPQSDNVQRLKDEFDYE